ncbi:hypothetical protein F4818DRAFT_444083 [Hypoxylon cercidicola]|nr:hypothetical protein F4818DRAFT_444083 [Hypoxylon cercidicola]
MPRPHIPPLAALFYTSSHGGMLWETRGEQSDEGKTNFRFLLQHPHSFRISKVSTKGLKTERRIIISLALSDIYEYAAENIDSCGCLEPEEFFGRAKDCYEWSQPMTDAAFWAFTYKAFHARARFLATCRDPKKLEATQPLAAALDAFQHAFLECYPVDHVNIAADGNYSKNQEDIESVNDEVSRNTEIREKYFPHHLTHHAAEGDGTDKLITNFKRHPKRAPRPQEDLDDLDMSKVPDEELFFYDTECKAKHHDAFKDVPNKVGSGSKRDLPPTEAKRSYNAFLDYRESGVEDEEEGEGAGQSKEAVDRDGAVGEEELPDLKKLKISEEEEKEEKEEPEEVPDVEKLKISDD